MGDLRTISGPLIYYSRKDNSKAHFHHFSTEVQHQKVEQLNKVTSYHLEDKQETFDLIPTEQNPTNFSFDPLKSPKDPSSPRKPKDFEDSSTEVQNQEVEQSNQVTSDELEDKQLETIGIITPTERDNTTHRAMGIALIEPNNTFPGFHAKPNKDEPWSSIKVDWPTVNDQVNTYIITIESEGEKSQSVKTQLCECVFNGLIPSKKYCVKVLARLHDGTEIGFPDLYCQTSYPYGSEKYKYMTQFADNEIIKKHTGNAPVYRKVLKHEKYAVKRIQKIALEEEVDILSRLNTHENVIQYKGYEEDKVFVYVSLEHCEASLDDMITRKHSALDDKVHAMRQIGKGLHFLHNKSHVLHRNLKPSNILYNKHCLKLADFSISKQTNDVYAEDGPSKGSRGYMPYEIIRKHGRGEGRVYSKKSDIFSLGVLFYYIQTCGENPFDSEELDPNTNIILKQNPIFPEEHFGNSLSCQDILSKMLSHDPENRPNIDGVLAHPFFWDDDTKIRFITVVSEFLSPEKKQKDVDSHDAEKQRLIQSLNAKDNLIFPTEKKSWVDAIPDEKYREKLSGCGRTVTDLVIYMRNQFVNIDGIHEIVREVVGQTKLDLLKYFEKCFPKLLVVIHETMAEMKDEENFKRFYKIKE